MSEPVTVSYSIEEILKGIESKFDKIDQKLDKAISRIESLEVGQARVEEKVTGLEKRLDDTNSRLNSVFIGFVSIFGILVTGLLTVVGKLVFFPGNP